MPFSWELLEAAFKVVLFKCGSFSLFDWVLIIFFWSILFIQINLQTDRRKIQRIFQQEQDAIVKASKEQIQAMSRRDEEGGSI